ncbi:hypothetical protein L6R50_19215 [Myxococcota bacterium]|nr:hypothetical protein [Myxococcota bacterium]
MMRFDPRFRATLLGAALALAALPGSPGRAEAAATWGAVTPAEGVAGAPIPSITVLPFAARETLVEGDIGKPDEADERKAGWSRALQAATVKALGKSAVAADNLLDRTGLVLRGEFLSVDTGSEGPVGEVIVYAEIVDAADPLKPLYGFVTVAGGRVGSGDAIGGICKKDVAAAVAKAVKGAAKAKVSDEAVERLADLRARQGKGSDEDDEPEMKAPVAPGASEAGPESGDGGGE